MTVFVVRFSVRFSLAALVALERDEVPEWMIQAAKSVAKPRNYYGQ